MGNAKSGRKKSPRRIAEDELMAALDKVAYEKAQRKDGVKYFLEHYIKKAFADSNLMRSVVNKLIPDLKHIENDGSLVDQSKHDHYTIVIRNDAGKRDRDTIRPTPLTGQGKISS